MKKQFSTLLFLILVFMFLMPLQALGDNVYTVTYRDWNGKFITEDEVEEGQSAYFHTHIRIGYEFVGWGYDVDTLNNSVLVDVTEDRTAYAIYKPNDYTVRFMNEDGSVLLETVMQRDSEVLPLTDELFQTYPESIIIPIAHESYEYRKFVREDIYMNDTYLMYIVETTFELDVTVVEIPHKDGYFNKGFAVELVKEPEDFYPVYEEIPVEVAPIEATFDYVVEDGIYRVQDFTENLTIADEDGITDITLPSIIDESFTLTFTREDLIHIRQTVTSIHIPTQDVTITIPPSGILNWLLSDFESVQLNVGPTNNDSYEIDGKLVSVNSGLTIKTIADNIEIPHYLIIEFSDTSQILKDQQEYVVGSVTEYRSTVYDFVTLSDLEQSKIEDIKLEPETVSEPDVVESTLLDQLSDTREAVDNIVMDNLIFIPILLVGLFILIYAGVVLTDKK